MRLQAKRILIVAVLCAAVSSCGSKVETRLAFPDAADLKADPEPPYPEAALQPGEAGAKAEEAWFNDVLAWGRTHHARVARICGWARDLKMPLPQGYCGPE